jgi:hypothetical protein
MTHALARLATWRQRSRCTGTEEARRPSGCRANAGKAPASRVSSRTRATAGVRGDKYGYGDIDARSDQQDVSGTLYLEDGRSVSFDGEWDGNGEVEGYDEYGNYYKLEVD